MTGQADFFGGAGRKMGDGHAGRPGSGPDGETCGTCCNVRRQASTQNTYFKCGIGYVTRGPATDIRLKDPACEHWQGEVE